MNSNNNIQLLYELNAKEAQLDFAIRQAEQQLAGVNKKLQMLWYDLVISVVVAVLPWFVYLLFSRSRFPLMMAFCTVFKGVYLMALPLMIYQMAKAASLLRLNREDAVDYTEPTKLGTLRDGQPDREPSYRAEQKKLICILTRYYLNKETIGQIRREIIESDSGTMTSAELYYRLSSMPFYEEVRPAQEFAGSTGGGAALPLFPSLIIIFIIGVLYALYVWRSI